jgi:Fe-S cluster biogenesis protein NfuA
MKTKKRHFRKYEIAKLRELLLSVSVRNIVESYRQDKHLHTIFFANERTNMIRFIHSTTLSRTRIGSFVPSLNILQQQRRNIFIETESTPNPQSLKFLPKDQEVLPEKYGTGIHFESSSVNSLNNNNQQIIYSSPLVAKLFKNIQGIKSVFLGTNFITVTKDSNENWAKLKPFVFSQLFDHYASKDPVIEEKNMSGGSSSPMVSDTTILDTDTEIVAAIKELIETRIRPSVQEDGGDIFYVDFDVDTGLVKVKLAGSCVGCPSSSVTLRNGVENMLTHYVPEVTGIVDVTAEEGEQPAKLHFDP